MTDRKYRLELTQQQARIVIDALDLYSRVGMGQIQEIAGIWRREGCRPADAAVQPVDTALAEILLAQAKTALTGFARNASHGIRSPHVPDRFKVAYDIQQVVQHRLVHDADPENKGYSCWHNEPWRTSEREPLAKIEQVEGSTAEQESKS